MATTFVRILPTSGENAREAQHEQRPSNGSQQAKARGKRAQVVAACQACRRRKIKCDALRPCTPCARRKESCCYETQHGETHSRASKRRYDEMLHSYETYVELFNMLRSRSDHDGSRILSHIQAGHSPEAVLALVRTGNAASIAPDPGGLALRAFLINLAHSTASLRDIITLASFTLEKQILPNPQDFLALRNRTVRLSHVQTLVQQSVRSGSGSPTLLLDTVTEPSERDNPSALSALNNTFNKDEDVGGSDDPPHQVPAAPWTTITTNDEAVSHLVSLFLAWINPTWRFVEEDLFLLGMQSKRLGSEFCSPFLVNSICAIASLHSEHEIAFPRQDQDRISRGEHFHNEALRLWVLEEGRSTLTNVQALCVLSLESNYRAKDKFGLTLVPTALQLNDDLPFQGDEIHCAARGISMRDFARARLSTHWTVVCTHIIMRIAFMSAASFESRASGIPKIHDAFNDSVEFWVGYPLTRSSVAHRPTLYLRERCKLAGLFQEMHDLIFVSDGQHSMNIRNFSSAVDGLAEKMQHWYQHLPFELHYEWPMSIAVWELHASYLAFLMVLMLVARTRSQQIQEPLEAQQPPAEPDEEDASFRSQMAQGSLSTAIPLAHTAAQIICDFRERYGLKITPAWLLQLQAVTAGVLVLDPELTNSSVSPKATQREEPIRDSHTAFDEIFRSLLGTGVEVMIARGIARMMYHTALEQNIVLSGSTRSLLKIMSDTTWRPSDLSLVNSKFPNFATTKGHRDRERMTELLTKWEGLEI